MKSLPELEAMNNGDLLAYIRSVTADVIAADLLKLRWEQFWETDHITLANQRDTIVAQAETITQLRARVQKFDELTLEAQVLKLRRDNRELQRQHANKELSRPQPDSELLKENRRLRSKVQTLEHNIDVLNARLGANISPRDAIMCIPPFETISHGRMVLAKEVRIARQKV